MQLSDKINKYIHTDAQSVSVDLKELVEWFAIALELESVVNNVLVGDAHSLRVIVDGMRSGKTVFYERLRELTEKSNVIIVMPKQSENLSQTKQVPSIPLELKAIPRLTEVYAEKESFKRDKAGRMPSKFGKRK